MDRAWPRSWTGAAVLTLLVFAVYGGVFRHGFTVFDDPSYITDNPMVMGGLSREGVWWAFTTGLTGNWHPLTWLSHMADFSLFGMAPGGHHFVSVAFHAVNGVLLFRLMDELTDAWWPSFAVACLFAVHPLHVESVAWVAERKDVLSTFFGLLSLLAYARHCRQPEGRWLVASLAALVASLLSKSTLVTLPILMLLLDAWPLKRAPRWREKAPFFLVAAVFAGITFLVQRANGNVSTLQAHPLLPRLANAALSALLYIRMMFWPSGLAVFHPFPPLAGLLWKGAAALLVLGGATAAAWRARGSRPYLWLGWAWYLVTLLPVIGIVQVGTQGLADRYTYIPLVGPFIILAWAGKEAAQPRVMAGCLVIAVAFLGIGARTQAATWKNSVTLFTHAIRSGNDCALVRSNLGMARYLEGDFTAAEVDYQVALTLNSSDSLAHAGLGKALWGAGRHEEAVSAYRKAVRFRPGDPDGLYRLGRALAATDHGDEALARLGEFLRIGPGAGNPAMVLDARMVSGLILRSQGRHREAARCFSDAVDSNPGERGAHLNLALAQGAFQAGDGRPGESRKAYRRALALDPRNAEALRALD